MEICSSVTTYQTTQQRDSQNKLQTCQQLTIHLQNNRKVHPKSTNQTLWHAQHPPRIPISLQKIPQL